MTYVLAHLTEKLFKLQDWNFFENTHAHQGALKNTADWYLLCDQIYCDFKKYHFRRRRANSIVPSIETWGDLWSAQVFARASVFIDQN